MIKFETNNGVSHVEVNGTIPEIQSEISVLIADVYNTIKKASEEYAECFLEGLIRFMSDSDSPLFKEEENEQA